MRTLLVGVRVTDPDGYLIELVQWPEGHAGGLTADDFKSG